MAGSHSGHMVTDFESAFQSCLAALTNEDHFNVHDPEETKAGVEQTVAKFLDMAKQMECFFLQKRLVLSAQRPEQIVREDITDLKAELQRKEQLIQKHYEKIQVWQQLLSNVQGPGHRPQPMPPNQPPPHVQALPHQFPSGPSTSQQSPMNINQGGPTQIPMMHMNQTMNQVGQVSSMPQPMQSMPQNPMYVPPSSSMSQQMGGNSGGLPPHMQHPSMHSTRLQGPLAYLEKTTSNIGMPDQRQ